ncbi:MAG: stage 0 sporulation family protein [Myxococcota bacterium]
MNDREKENRQLEQLDEQDLEKLEERGSTEDIEPSPRISPESLKDIELVGVRLERTSLLVDSPAQGIELKVGDRVIIETARGYQMGVVVYEPRIFNTVPSRIYPLVRKATEEDIKDEEDSVEVEKKAFQFCQKRIKDWGLPMKLVRTERPVGGGKIIFYFSADGRVDFRKLVKDLAYSLRTRIEMRQIGVRDEARVLGGIGPCGQYLCCCRFLRAFETVTIKMAKDQGLALNPQKVSGVCGRLMCCLGYEVQAYQELIQRLPRIGQWVKTPTGEGKVLYLNILRQTVKVSEGDEIKEWTVSDVQPAQRPEREEAFDNG